MNTRRGRTKTVSEALREAVKAGPKSQYRLCKETGIDPAVLSRFKYGRVGLSLASIDVLVTALGMELRPVQGARPPKKGG